MWFQLQKGIFLLKSEAPRIRSQSNVITAYFLGLKFLRLIFRHKFWDWSAHHFQVCHSCGRTCPLWSWVFMPQQESWVMQIQLLNIDFSSRLEQLGFNGRQILVMAAFWACTLENGITMTTESPGTCTCRFSSRREGPSPRATRLGLEGRPKSEPADLDQ